MSTAAAAGRTAEVAAGQGQSQGKDAAPAPEPEDGGAASESESESDDDEDHESALARKPSKGVLASVLTPDRLATAALHIMQARRVAKAFGANVSSTVVQLQDKSNEAVAAVDEKLKLSERVAAADAKYGLSASAQAVDERIGFSETVAVVRQDMEKLKTKYAPPASGSSGSKATTPSLQEKLVNTVTKTMVSQISALGPPRKLMVALDPHSLCFIDTERYPGAAGCVALTIDDAPCRSRDPADCMLQDIRKLLAEFKAKATFFMCTDFVPGHEKDLVSLLQDGHEVANHGGADRPYGGDSLEEFEAQLLESESVCDRLRSEAAVPPLPPTASAPSSSTRQVVRVAAPVYVRPAGSPTTSASSSPIAGACAASQSSAAASSLRFGDLSSSGAGGSASAPVGVAAGACAASPSRAAPPSSLRFGDLSLAGAGSSASAPVGAAAGACAASPSGAAASSMSFGDLSLSAAGSTASAPVVATAGAALPPSPEPLSPVVARRPLQLAVDSASASAPSTPVSSPVRVIRAVPVAGNSGASPSSSPLGTRIGGVAASLTAAATAWKEARPQRMEAIRSRLPTTVNLERTTDPPAQTGSGKLVSLATGKAFLGSVPPGAVLQKSHFLPAPRERSSSPSSSGSDSSSSAGSEPVWVARRKWFRAPHADASADMKKALKRHGFTNVLCDSFANDTIITDPEFISQKCIELIDRRGGSIVVIHTPERGFREHNLQAMRRFLELTVELGLTVVSVTGLTNAALAGRHAE